MAGAGNLEWACLTSSRWKSCAALRGFSLVKTRWPVLMNVRTAAPKVGEGLSGRVAASFETDNGEYFEGHMSAELTDNFAMRLAIMDRSIDGYLDNNRSQCSYPNMPTTDETIMPDLVCSGSPLRTTSVGLRYTYADYERIGSNSGNQFGPTIVDGIGAGLCLHLTPQCTVMGIYIPWLASNANNSSRCLRDGLSIGGTEAW